VVFSRASRLCGRYWKSCGESTVCADRSPARAQNALHRYRYPLLCLSNMTLKVCIIPPELSIGGAEMHVHIGDVVGRIEDLYEWFFRNKVRA
jgi:hypothetical protein